MNTNDSPPVAALRELLREGCDDCPACGGDEADTPTADMLAAWLRRAPAPSGIEPAWLAHLDEAWRDKILASYPVG